MVALQLKIVLSFFLDVILSLNLSSHSTDAPDEKAKVYSGIYFHCLFIVHNNIFFYLPAETLKYARLSTLPLFFGSVVYAFEGIGVVSGVASIE